MASKKRGLYDPNREMQTRESGKRYPAYNVQPQRPKRKKSASGIGAKPSRPQRGNSKPIPMRGRRGK